MPSIGMRAENRDSVISGDTVTISGRVTDFEGQPIESCTVCWQDTHFNSVSEVLTDKDGRYVAHVPKGKYRSLYAIYAPSYEMAGAKSGLPESERRLEFWGWNYVADRDTMLNIRYDRMEAYGLHVFSIPGAAPVYQIYVRPISLTRSQRLAGEKNQMEEMAPPVDALDVRVTIDDENVPLLQKQEIKEYIDADHYMRAYLLTVGRSSSSSDKPYRLVRVELHDTENGDRGEGIYCLEENKYVK